MAEQNSNRGVRSHPIVKVLSVLGYVLIVLGVLLGILFPVVMVQFWSSFRSINDDPSTFEALVRAPWVVLTHIAAGAICLGVAKAIRILEEIRAGA